MGFPNTTPVVYVECTVGGFYLHDRDAAPYTEILERLGKLALSQNESRKVISDLLKGL
jgi:hypothetical protein